MSASAHQLTPYLKQLRLSGILETLDVRTQQAIADQWSYLEFLTRLVQDEVERRGQKQLDRRIRRGGVTTTKTLESFDFTFNPAINRQQVYDLATCAFIRERRNVLICGQTGVGKSHLGHALAHEAARKGFDVLFTAAHRMLAHLGAGRADGSYEKRLAAYTKPHLLVIDDFGLKPLPPPAPRICTTSSTGGMNGRASCSQAIGRRASGPSSLAIRCSPAPASTAWPTERQCS